MSDSAKPFYCAVAKTSTAGRCTTNCVRFVHGGRHCGGGRRLIPTELAREVGMERREVVRLCVEFGVPIFEGRIDSERFVAALKANEKR